MRELKSGGSEAPCPMCGLPRVKRTEYTRCVRCGVNWLTGEALDQDPRTERMRKLVENARANASQRPKKEEEHARR